MTSKKQTSWPVPLKERDIGLGTAVREYARSTESTPDEAAAYGRALERLAGPPRRAPWLLAGIGMGVAAAVVVVMVVPHPGARTASQDNLARVPTLPAAPTPAPAPPAPALPRTTPATLRLAATPSPLPVGQVTLVDVAQASVSADTVASGRAQAGHTEIALDKGRIELHVMPRGPDQDFQVSAGDYRFVVVGTVFAVSQTESRIELSVSEGKVAVWRGSDRVTIVGAGGQWAMTLAPTAAKRPRAMHTQPQPAPVLAMKDPLRDPLPTPASSSVPTAALVPAPVASPPVAIPNPEPIAKATATPSRDCGVLAGRPPQEAMGCYQQQAARGGLAGEAAQYEIGRLWRDAFHDPARALAAFRDQRSRFPQGVLAIEADLSIIELLPRLDRHAEALAESERFLKEHPGAERRGELHLLRGNIYREALRDLDHAEREYALGAEARGRAGDESRFLRAVCLETLGKTEEARKAYESYLSQPKAAHAADAKKRLERLGP